jgi:hypothetical protein
MKKTLYGRFKDPLMGFQTCPENVFSATPQASQIALFAEAPA